MITFTGICGRYDYIHISCRYNLPIQIFFSRYDYLYKYLVVVMIYLYRYIEVGMFTFAGILRQV